jgi:hypothetical protein
MHRRKYGNSNLYRDKMDSSNSKPKPNGIKEEDDELSPDDYEPFEKLNSETHIPNTTVRHKTRYNVILVSDQELEDVEKALKQFYRLRVRSRRNAKEKRKQENKPTKVTKIANDFRAICKIAYEDITIEEYRQLVQTMEKMQKSDFLHMLWSCGKTDLDTKEKSTKLSPKKDSQRKSGSSEESET